MAYLDDGSSAGDKGKKKRDLFTLYIVGLTFVL